MNSPRCGKSAHPTCRWAGPRKSKQSPRPDHRFSLLRRGACFDAQRLLPCLAIPRDAMVEPGRDYLVRTLQGDRAATTATGTWVLYALVKDVLG
jgi:hypothetical protein